MKGQLADWRRGVDVLREGMPLDASRVEQNGRVDKLAEGPCQAIQLPDDDDVALAGVVEELHQLGLCCHLEHPKHEPSYSPEAA
jgi:hypothetical protein